MASIYPGGEGCCIRQTELRGITLAQLRQVLQYVEEHCVEEKWTDRDGTYLTAERVNLYHVCDQIILPKTEKRKCSYVELIARSSEEQKPRWFVSHYWGAPFRDLVQCLEEHKRSRGLFDDPPSYWICAFALNQWRLEEEIPSDDPADTSFRKALDISEGTLVVVDEDAECFSRIWCRYEGFISLMSGTKLYDFVAKRSRIGISLLSDGMGHGGYFDHHEPMTTEEMERFSGIPATIYLEKTFEAIAILDRTHRLDCFESRGHPPKTQNNRMSENEYLLDSKWHFPKHVAGRVLSSSLEAAKCSFKADRVGILNSIVRSMDPDSAQELHAEPLQCHPAYSRLDDLLRARFAIALWSLASCDVEAWGMADRARIVRESDIKVWSLDTREFEKENKLREIAEALPQHLEILELSIGVRETSKDLQALAARLPKSLDKLILSMIVCDGLDDKSVSDLAANLSPELTELALIFYDNDYSLWNCNKFSEYRTRSFNENVSDDAMKALTKWLPPKLKTLTIDIGGWVNITTEAFLALVKRLPETLTRLRIGLTGCGEMDGRVLEGLAQQMSLLPRLEQLALCLEKNIHHLKDFEYKTQDIQTLRDSWSPRDLNRQKIDFGYSYAFSMEGLRVHEDAKKLMNAAKNGDLEMMQSARANGCPWREGACAVAAEGGHLEILQYAHTNGCPWDKVTCARAAKNGHLEVLKYAHENGCEWDEDTCAHAAKNGDLEMLKYAHEKGCPWSELTCAWAAKNGHLELLKYARDNGCEWGINVFVEAAKNGRLEILVYAHENGCEWDEDTCAHAAKNGDLEMLKYAHEKGCPWSELTCAWAALNGHLEVLKWARENGCEWDKWTCALAAGNGQLEALKWAREHGCPWDYQTCAWATRRGHTEIFEWARDNGCPQSQS